MLSICLTGTFLNGADISLLSKTLNFVPRYSNADKAKLKMELEAFARMLRLKWHFRNSTDRRSERTYVNLREA